MIGKHVSAEPINIYALACSISIQIHVKYVIVAYSFFLLLNADNAPAAIVSLVGTKEYDKCAKDLYYFLQVVIVIRRLKMLVSFACPISFVTTSFLCLGSHLFA